MKTAYYTCVVLALFGVGLLMAQAPTTHVVTITTAVIPTARAEQLAKAIAAIYSSGGATVTTATHITTATRTVVAASVLTLTVSTPRGAAALQADAASFLDMKVQSAAHAQTGPSQWSHEDLAPFQGVVVRGVTAQ